MNKSVLIGNLTKDVEKIQGHPLVKFTIAVNEDYTKEDGTRPVQYFNIVCWNKLAEICEKYLSKGKKVAIIGKLQNRTYEASDGTKKYVTEIVANDVEFLSPIENKISEKLEEIEDGELPF